MYIHDRSVVLAPPFVVADLDGTLALFGNRNPFVRDFTADKINQPVKDALWGLRENLHYSIVIMSGRNSKFSPQTRHWLAEHNVPFERLYMRVERDQRPDEVVKQEFMDDLVGIATHKVHSIFDDRPRMVRHWRSKGFFVFDCNTRPDQGDF